MSGAEVMVSKVADFYNGRSIFVTGATGFMGKVLLYKLLDSSPDIKAIYVLIRPKRGVEPQERFRVLLKTKPFEKLGQKSLDLLDKVKVLCGDITLPQLGLSEDDVSLLTREVSVIFHTAATVKFDEALSKSVRMNVLGTLSIIELARRIGPNLASFVHVSTAYSHCHQPYIEERFYDMDTDPARVIEMCKTIDPEHLDDPQVTKKLIGDHPNTYTFTKAVAEQIIKSRSNDLPVCVFRPSIIVAAVKEPFPGWIDNLNGPTGIFAASAGGIIRSMVAHRMKKADIMPVDVAINLMCVLGWKMAQKSIINPRNDVVPIYNCTSGESNPFTWGDFETIALKHIRRYPLEMVLWYPGGSFKRSKMYHKICHLFVHAIPAVVVDVILYMMGKKGFMVRTMERITSAMNVLEYFSTKEWAWSNTNVQRLQDDLDDADKNLYNCDLKRLPDWDGFIESYIIGIRHFLLKNRPESLPSCQKKMKIMRLLDLMARIFLFVVGYKICLSLWTAIS